MIVGHVIFDSQYVRLYPAGEPNGLLFPIDRGPFEDLLRWSDRGAVERAIRNG